MNSVRNLICFRRNADPTGIVFSMWGEDVPLDEIQSSEHAGQAMLTSAEFADHVDELPLENCWE